MKIKLRIRNSFKWKDTPFIQHSESLSPHIFFEIVYYNKNNYLNLFCVYLSFAGKIDYHKKPYHFLSREERLAIPRWLSGVKIKILSKRAYLVRINFAYYEKFNIVFFGSDKDEWPRDKTFIQRFKEYFKIK